MILPFKISVYLFNPIKKRGFINCDKTTLFIILYRFRLEYICVLKIPIFLSGFAELAADDEQGNTHYKGCDDKHGVP